MKQRTGMFILFLALIWPLPAFAEIPMLKGQVYLVNDNDKEIPAPNVTVFLEGSGSPTTTLSLGDFELPLPTKKIQKTRVSVYPAGASITIMVKKTGWVIHEPIKGKTRIPEDLLRERVAIKLLPEGSPKLWSHGRIKRFIEDLQAKDQINPTQEQTPLDFQRYLKDWAGELGFSAEQAKAEVEKWVSAVKKKRDPYEQGLAEFFKQNFDKARPLLKAGAELKKQELEAHREKTLQIVEETVMRYRKTGDAAYSDYDFTGALVEYEQAFSVFHKREHPQLWADLQMDIASANWAIGIRIEGQAARNHLHSALLAYAAAASAYESLKLREGVAAAQVGKGLVLNDQGIRTGGEDGRRLLGEAVGAYRAALEVRTREQLPQDWAMTQNNLGTALNDQGIRTGGEDGRRLLGEAVGAYRAALEVYTREQLPQDWAMTQNNLGTALNEQGIRTGGEDGRRLLGEAVGAFKLALEVRTRESLAPQWAQTHNNLAEAALALQDWEQVVTSYQNVLGVYPDYAKAYQILNATLHEHLFRYEKVYSLNQHWLSSHSNDVSAQSNFAEAHFTTGRFAEAETRLGELLANPKLDANSKVALQIIQIGAFAAQGKDDVIPKTLQALRELIGNQPEEFQLGWSFLGTKHFIGQHEALASSREFLLDLIAGFEGKDKTTMLATVESVQTKFVAAMGANAK